jgi:3-isopropylmalate dehydrogenase
MQSSHIRELPDTTHKNVKNKSAYYGCDLFSSQSIKGKSYADLVKTYQITFIAYTVLPKSADYKNEFKLRTIGGDILTDEASQIAGSMGMLASASVGDGTGVYEPIHGSAHDITGKGVANPLASILSAALLLDISFGMKTASETIINAVDKVLKNGFRTKDIADAQTPADKILGTTAMGEEVLKGI